MKMVSNILTRIPPLFSDLSKILNGEIDCTHEILTAYASNSSPYFIIPQAVMYPKNVTDIKHILAFAREYRMPVTVRGNGNSPNGGSLGEGIIVDMSRYFNHIRNVNMIDNTITVDAGVPVQFLLEKLHSWQCDIPVLTSQNKDASIGAIIANKSTSTSSFHHGTIREWIEGITVVVDNGEEHSIADGITPSGRLLGIYQSVFPLLTKENPTLRATKPTSHDDPTGYNLWSTSIGPRQLIEQLVGSEGTLGIITSVTFRISPYKKHAVTTCIPIIEKRLLPVFIEMAKHHNAEHIFLYDATVMHLADRYHPTLVPFFKDAHFVLLATHTSDNTEKLHQITTVFKKTIARILTDIETQETDSFTTISEPHFLHSLYELYTNATLTPISVADGIIIDIEHVPSFLEEAEDYLDSLGNLYTITGNIGSGHMGITALFDPNSKAYDISIADYSRRIFSIVKKYNGGISASGGEGLSRTPFIPGIYGDATVAIFKKIKDAWDPLSILNPGKKIGTTTHYLSQHIKRTLPS